MKGIIIIIITSLFATSCLKQDSTVNNHRFVSDHINNLQNNNQTLIVEFWAPSCSPCIKLKNDIFDSDKNSDFIKNNFILVTVSPADSLYNALFKYYNLQTQSTVLFFDKKGNEIDRSVGYDGNKELYLEFLNNIVNREKLYHEIYSDYLKDTSDIISNYLLAKKFLFRYENQRAVKLFKFILLNDTLNKHGFNSECSFRLAEYNFINTGNIEPFKSYINMYSDNEFSPQAYIYLINYYQKKEDDKNCIFSSGEAVRKFPYNPDLLNKQAWNIYQFKIKEDYTDALEMIETAIEINPHEARYWDTQAWLYFELGENLKAFQSEKKAVELLPHLVYKETLKSFELKKNTHS
jgi:thioredoxin-related protein